MNQKTKTFITAIPFQGKDRDGNDGLKETHYQPDGCPELEYGKTRFPIVPVIANSVKKDDNVRIICILTDGENFKHNYDTYFVPEITDLQKEIGFRFNQVEIIDVSDTENIDTHLKLFTDIISVIKDNEDLYACITYGTKPTPVVLSMALNYAYKLKKNTTVERIVYGRFLHFNKELNKTEGYLYDTTPLFYMDSIVNKLSEIGAPHPEDAIKTMLGFKFTEE